MALGRDTSVSCCAEGLDKLHDMCYIHSKFGDFLERKGNVTVTSRALTTQDDFGPEMRKLDMQEQMFVCALYENPRSATQAARNAGIFSKSAEGLRQQAHRLMRDPRIAAAMVEESKRRNVFLLPKTHKALNDLLDNPQATSHFGAVKLIRDDAGVTRALERTLNVNLKVDRDTQIRELKEFAAAHGGTVLGVPIEHITGETTDAEFEEVARPITLEDLI